MRSKATAVIRTGDVIVAVVAVLALILAACSGESTDTEASDATTTTIVTESGTSGGEAGELEFGRGQLPETVPADFPIPDEAVIGATMVDRTRDLTQVITTYPANVPAVVEFYEINLPALGYAIDASSGTDASWTIEFSSEASTGEIVLEVGGSGLTQGSLSIVTPIPG